MPDLPRDIPHDHGFVEIGDRCWVARFESFDVNVGVVAGDRGLLVVDTRASEVEGRVALELVRRLGLGDVVAVVNTHQHFDHTFGNVVFTDAYDGLPVIAHDAAAKALAATAPALQEFARTDTETPNAADIAAARVVLPTETFSSARVVDLGDRFVELVHPGRGHTAGDVIVRVGDADVVFAGDLVEESAQRSAVPGYGDDCYPMEWPASLDLVIGLLTPGSVVVPGHGLPVDKDFVDEQRTAIGVVAETIRHLASQGVPVRDALAATEWPYPAEQLALAVQRGYEQLPRAARSLPLI
jgi:glyoxylase-like metal-dependent hydrolase (beta-lactamase superfamily II)